MAKTQYIGVAGVARNASKQYIGVGGVARNVKSAYVGVDGVARQYLGSGFRVSDLPIGSSVYMKIDGVSKECIVVHKGNPDAAHYDNSCNGVWVLMKDIYLTTIMSSSYTDYPKTSLHAYLNNKFFDLLDAPAKSAIKEVVLPYMKTDKTVMSGADGVTTRVFLLSMQELGFAYSELGDGRKLDYFNGDDVRKLRTARYNGSAHPWWMRTPEVIISGRRRYYFVTYDGISSSGDESSVVGVRPAFILEPSAIVSQNTMTII